MEWNEMKRKHFQKFGHAADIHFVRVSCEREKRATECEDVDVDLYLCMRVFVFMTE